MAKQRMGRTGKITLRDVAQRANVSPSTVSRALNGFEFVEESTRVAILAAAHELGYVVKGSAAKPAPRKTVLMLARRSTEEPGGQEVSLAGVERRISNGVVDACQRDGLATRIQPVDMTSADAIQFAQEPSLLGIIFLGGMIRPDFARKLEQQGLPFMVVGARVQGMVTSCVTADYCSGIEQAVTHLAQGNRTSIGFVNGSAATQSSIAKYKGYRLGLAVNGLDFNKANVRNGDFSSDSGYEETRQMLADSSRIDAILYASDEMAIGGLHALKELGRTVPADVAVVGFHNTHAAQYTDPPLTTVNVDLRQMGRIAGARIQQIAEEPEQPQSTQEPWTIVVPTTLVVRQSA